jgi:hypothetical protein
VLLAASDRPLKRVQWQRLGCSAQNRAWKEWFGRGEQPMRNNGKSAAGRAWQSCLNQHFADFFWQKGGFALNTRANAKYDIRRIAGAVALQHNA